MNKKGFTLVEILIVIAILAAISVTVGINMMNIKGQEKDKEYNTYIKNIENAGCLYVEINNISTNTFVNIDTLINAGLLRKDVINPKNNKKIQEDSEIKGVNISWDKNEKKCTISTS